MSRKELRTVSEKQFVDKNPNGVELGIRTESLMSDGRTFVSRDFTKPAQRKAQAVQDEKRRLAKTAEFEAYLKSVKL